MRILNLLLAVAVAFTCSCALNRTFYGMVQMDNGRPIPPKQIPRMQLGNSPTGSFRSQGNPHTILVMDSGADFRDQSSLTYLMEMLEEYAPNNQGDLPVHYFIDPEGVVYSARQPQIPAQLYPTDAFLSRTKTMPDLQDVLMARLAKRTQEPLDLDGYLIIMVLGDYDQQLVSEEQEQPLFQLIAYLAFQHEIRRTNIRTFRSVFPEYANPGFYLNNYFDPSTVERNIPQPPERPLRLNPPSSAEPF